MYCLTDSDDLSDTLIEEDKADQYNDSDSTIIDCSTVAPLEHDIVLETATAYVQNKLDTTNKFCRSQQPTVASYNLSKVDYNELLDSTTNSELDLILRKYSCNVDEHSKNDGVLNTNKLVECIELSSDEDIPPISVEDCTSPLLPPTNTLLIQNIKLTPTHSLPKQDQNKNNRALNVSDEICKADRKKPKLSPVEKEKKKLEKFAERIKKKEEAQREKLIKQSLTAANKNVKPEECMKFITVSLDMQIANESYGGEVLNALQAASIAYTLRTQIVPKTITWSRSVQNQIVDSSGTLQLSSETFEVNHALILMDWKEAVDLVHNKKFCEHVKSLQSILIDKKLFLGIYGLKDYFSYQKSQRQKNLRNEIHKSVQTSSNKCNKYKDVQVISKDALEIALTEVQIICSCCHRLLETKLDVGNLIAYFTKAVAQAPYKSEKHRKQQEADRYLAEDNRNSVQVGKEGNGIQKLWQQQLMSFPLARIEHAQAIMTKFPTLRSLMEEYSRCSQKEGEKMLQEIPIRRAAGPLTTIRKIGPELSKKIYTTFTSLDGSVVL